MRKRIVLLSIAVWLPLCVWAEKITFDDLYSLSRPRNPSVSPDGKQVVFVLREQDPVKATTTNHLWIMNTDGSGLRQLTDGEKGESSPQWSPDGASVVYVTTRDSISQVWQLPLKDTAQARALTDSPKDVGRFVLLPDGKSVLFVASVAPDSSAESAEKPDDDTSGAPQTTALRYDHLLHRRYNVWDDGSVKQLFVAQPDSSKPRNIHPVRFNVPTRHFDWNRDFAVSPDGEEICFAMSTDSVPAVWVNNDLFVVPAGGGKPERITDSRGLDNMPRYSPDGKYVAYLQTRIPYYEADQRNIAVYSRASRTHTTLTETFDRSIGYYLWAPGSQHIYFTAIDHGFNQVYRLHLATSAIDTLLQDAVYSGLAVSPDGTFLIVGRSRAHEPYELYRYDLESGKLGELTSFTKEMTERVDLVEAEEFWFAGAKRDRIHGVLTKPPEFDPQTTYPLVLLIHGGPQWCWFSDFSYYGWNTQLVAAQGYVVAQIDPHGSIGYGREFTESITGNWGKGDYDDLMKGIDYLLQEHPFIDPKRIAALGRSYGGFMTNWICGHTDRFSCLVSVAGSYEEASQYGTTDELGFSEWELGGTPWDNPREYARCSPSTYAKNFRTPTMVIHGQKDYRVDLSQGLSMFTALQRQGVPSELVYFPDEGHNVRKIQNLRYLYSVQFEWLARFLK